MDDSAGCDDPLRADPCTVTVTLTYEFHVFAPVHIDVSGNEIGFPSTITIVRDSTFAITDIDLSPGRAVSVRRKPTRADPPLDAARPLVEFALVAPVFFVLLFAIIEGGRFMILLRDAEQRDPRGRAVRDRERWQHARMPQRTARAEQHAV